jgi:transcriptional regulator with XRE-family HTH domain
MKTFGERVRELREQKGMSLRELAKQLLVSAAFLSDIELGRRYPSDKVLPKMASILEASVEDLKAYDSRPPVEEIKRLASADPQYSVAFRQVIDRKITAKELIEFIENKTRGKKK